MEPLTNEELVEFTTNNLSWIHIIEKSICRRMTEEDIYKMYEMVMLNGWLTYANDQAELMNDIRDATSNFIEGIA